MEVTNNEEYDNHSHQELDDYSEKRQTDLLLPLYDALQRAAPSTKALQRMVPSTDETDSEVQDIAILSGMAVGKSKLIDIILPRLFPEAPLDVRGSRLFPEAPLDEAHFLDLIKNGRDYLNQQRQERFYQARATFAITLAALTIGILLVCAGIICIFTINLSVGIATSISSIVVNTTSALAFKFNKEANDRLDYIIKELSVIDRTLMAMYYINWISDKEKKDLAIIDLTKQLNTLSSN